MASDMSKANAARDKRRAKRKKIFLDALENNMGIVTPTCRDCGIHRQEHYQWLVDDKDYATEVAWIKEVALDFGESALYKQIKEGGVPSTIFFLKTQGKDRGYVERRELDVDGDLSLTVQFIE
jgi:hypothetical protein